MSPSSLLLPTPNWRRRDWLAAAGLAALPLTALTQPAGGASLPAAQSLPDELARAIKNRQPLIVMASLEGCVFCRQARQSHLSPMHKAGTVIVQVDLRSKQPVLDFAGQLTTHDQLTRQWKITITPTLLFFGPGGKEVAERMEGAYLPDFYGPYLEERLATGRKSL
ncbi:MAG: hypothetical protein RL075_1979 [Pseudomonadota bacterium]